jgi:deoxyribodipyrimidine photo-lyase
MRAMLVSFASNHLWLDWRTFAPWLGRQFLDYEPGIHYPQVQMQSGTTGINTVRIYSPRKQVEDHDPRGEFIRRWVPELAAVPDEHLAEPHLMPELLQAMVGCTIGVDYPAPIVEHPPRTATPRSASSACAPRLRRAARRRRCSSSTAAASGREEGADGEPAETPAQARAQRLPCIQPSDRLQGNASSCHAMHA